MGLTANPLSRSPRFFSERTFEIAGISEPFRASYVVAPEGSAAARTSFTFELREIDLVMRPFQKLIRTALQEDALLTVENIKRLLEDSATA